MNTGKQHDVFPRTLIICPRVAFKRVDNFTDGERPLRGCPLSTNGGKGSGRAGAINSCPRSGSVTFGLRMRACHLMKVQGRNQGEQVPGMLAPMCPSTSLCARVTHRAPDNLLLGRRPRIRKDKPEGNGAASRTKGGCRARCARHSGSQVSSPVRAEPVVSVRKTVQRLVCTVFCFPSVPVQTDSVCRGRTCKRRPVGPSKWIPQLTGGRRRI